ncbi:MAG: phosphotransferase family protein, partial [bacterium]
MLSLTAENAVEYLHFSGYWPAHIPARASALTGGVSNLVVRVEPIDPASNEPSIIVKQSADLLRTKMEWRSRRERIWIETAAMQFLSEILADGTVPRIIFEDRDNCLFGMSDLGKNCQVWKQILLNGNPDQKLARNAGQILSQIHLSGIVHADRLRNSIFADTTVFDELRIDPYYRTIAKAHPQIALTIDRLIKTMATPPRPTLVLADFSPKNILVDSDGKLRLVDFETAHWGDPGFDLGFFMTHLTLKWIWAARQGLASADQFFGLLSTFWDEYQAGMASLKPDADLENRAATHLAACMLARVDGKSPVD